MLKQKALLAILVLALSLRTTLTQETGGYANLAFDCRRTGTVCSNSANCKTETGHCDCDGLDFHGFDCNVPIDVGEYDQPTCTQCDSIGTKYCDADNCYCDEFAHGTNCELRRIQHYCKGDGQMNLTVTPHGVFGGFMYLLAKKDDCDYTEDVRTNAMPIELITGDATCPADQVQSSDAQGRVTFNNTYEFMIEFDEKFQTGHDTIVKIMCGDRGRNCYPHCHCQH